MLTLSKMGKTNGCPVCKQWTSEYNIAVANGIMIKAKRIEIKLMAHYKNAHKLPGNNV